LNALRDQHSTDCCPRWGTRRPPPSRSPAASATRHYCSKKCQLVDWNGGHKAACRHLAAKFQDRLLDELMPLKLKIKEEAPIVVDVAPAAGLKAAPRLSAVRTQTTAVIKASATNDDTPGCGGTCAICLDLLPFGEGVQRFYECCCKTICSACADKCRQHDMRCPLCRAAPPKSNAEMVRRVQTHVDKGNAEAQMCYGDIYRTGGFGLKPSPERAYHYYQLSAVQGNSGAQNALGQCYESGLGVQFNFKTAVQWYRRAAEQGHPNAQFNLGRTFYNRQGVAQSFEEAAKWFGLAAAQGDAQALHNLGACYAHGQGVPQDLNEAMRCFKRAAAAGHPGAVTAVAQLEVLPDRHW